MGLGIRRFDFFYFFFINLGLSHFRYFTENASFYVRNHSPVPRYDGAQKDWDVTFTSPVADISPGDDGTATSTSFGTVSRAFLSSTPTPSTPCATLYLVPVLIGS